MGFMGTCNVKGNSENHTIAKLMFHFVNKGRIDPKSLIYEDNDKDLSYRYKIFPSLTNIFLEIHRICLVFQIFVHFI